MTVTYTAHVATSRGFSTFLRLLARWRGSIYKLVWLDLFVFLSLYFILALSYRLLMNDQAQRIFEDIVKYSHAQGSLIPLSFVLAFYVRIVMDRWWEQYIAIPWPDALAILVSAHIQGEDERARVMRRTIMRYTCLCQVIVFTMISPGVKRRFPTYQKIIEVGMLSENEKSIIEKLDVSFPHYPKHWMPIVWAASIVKRARREGKIRDDYAVKSIIDELNRFRGSCGYLLYYDWVSVPLVYTQVVTLATYTYFLCSVIGQQWTMDPDTRVASNTIDQYFPFFTTLQFFFYMGWLKVAESLINPFGEDDDDFELNWMIDRNLTVSYLIVDEMHQAYPELVKDQYWDEVFPNELPYADESRRVGPPQASTARLDNLSSVNRPGRRLQSSSTRSTTDDSSLDNMSIRMRSSTSESDRQSRYNTRSPKVSRILGAEQSRVTFSGAVSKSDGPASRREPPQNEGRVIHPSPKSLSFDELIAERKRERRERNRSHFRNMPGSAPPKGFYKVTVLRPPSPRSSQYSMSSAEQQEEEQEEEQSSAAIER